VLYLCIEYHILVNVYHVSSQGIDERMINVHYYIIKYTHAYSHTRTLSHCDAFSFFFLRTGQTK